jgi:phosphohistidine phosphatase SixA
MKVFLIRHGATDENLSLSKQGAMECKRLYKLFNKRSVDVIYCSPLKRTLETAHLIFPQQEITIENRLAPTCDSLSLLEEAPDATIAFVTHQPNIENLLSYLGYENSLVNTGCCLYYDGITVKRVI